MPDENPPSTSNAPEAAPAAAAPATPKPEAAPAAVPKPEAAAAATPAAPAAPKPVAAAPTAAAPATPATPKPAAAPAASAPAAVAEPAGPPKIKIKRPPQRACDERDAKNKLCCGHLKRWYDYPKEIEALIGAKAEVYRCEFCKTLYKPDRSVAPHSYTLRY
jgi:hypothetical protein